MGGEQASHDKLAFRLAFIISELFCAKKLSVKNLALEFGVCNRTILRDFKSRLAHLPIVFKDGFYFLDTTNVFFKNHEIVKFSQNAGIDGLYPDLNFIENFFSDDKKVVGYSYENINKTAFEILESCILDQKQAYFEYNDKLRVVNPYKLTNLNGIWYLVATQNAEIKNYTLSKIKNLKIGKSFKKDKEIEKFIEQNSDQFASKKLITIKLKIQKEISEFITRRQIFKRQVVLEQLNNGDIIIETRVAFLKDFMGVVRYWLPFVSILEPIHLRDGLLKELEIYIKKEKDASK